MIEMGLCPTRFFKKILPLFAPQTVCTVLSVKFVKTGWTMVSLFIFWHPKASVMLIEYIPEAKLLIKLVD